MPKAPKSTARRPSGKPKAADRPIGPAELIVIARLVLRHVPKTEIAARLGVSDATIRHHVETTIRPIWQGGIERYAEEELARLDEVERMAWERFDDSLTDETRETIKQELRAKPTKAKSKRTPKSVLETIERTVAKTNRSRSAPWLQLVLECVAERCKIKGFYAAQRMRIDVGGEIRVAGKSREDIDQELLQRIAFIVDNAARRKELTDAYNQSIN